MSRTIPAAIVTALAQKNVQPFYAVEMLFDSVPLRLWTGHGDRVVDGEVYTGTGALLVIDGLEEVSDLIATSATLRLSGISSSVISLALAEPYQGRRCRIMFGVIDVADHVEVFAGVMDTMSIQDSAGICTIDLRIESKLVTLKRPRVRRYTHESQQVRHPGDTFFSYVTGLQDKDVVWGRKSV